METDHFFISISIFAFSFLPLERNFEVKPPPWYAGRDCATYGDPVYFTFTGCGCLIRAYWSVLLIYLRFIYFYLTFPLQRTGFRSNPPKVLEGLSPLLSLKPSLDKTHIPIYLVFQASSCRIFYFSFFTYCISFLLLL